MQVLSYPRGAAAAIRVAGVRDQDGALVSDAELRFTLTTMAGDAIEGATDQLMAPVGDEPGAYEWVAPHALALDGQYRWRVVATRELAYTPVEGLLRVA